MIRMIIDTANVLFRVAAARSRYETSGTPEEQAGLSMHMALNSINKYFNKYAPDQVAFTFEGHNNWRKTYTKSDKCISKKVYKANRQARQADPTTIAFFELIQSFEKLLKNYTSNICLSNNVLEGDDLFAGFVKKFPNDEIIGISGDKDFVQLLKYKNFTLINPDTGKPRNLIDVCGVDDADYFMFEKAFRGDTGDNVLPAYPRVFKKRLLKAYSDEYELTQLLNETWTAKNIVDGKEIEQTFNVGDLVNENLLLMDLSAQPDNIKDEINKTIDLAIQNTNKFSFFHFQKFCGKYGLKKISESSASYAKMFSANGKHINKEQPLENKPKVDSLLQY